MNSIKEAKRDLTKKVVHSMQMSDGYNIREADSTVNDASRGVIDAYLREQPDNTYLGIVNRYEKEKPFIWKHSKEEFVYNFGAGFVIHGFDQHLLDLLENRDNEPYTGTSRDYELIKEIHAYIDQIGGSILVWG